MARSPTFKVDFNNFPCEPEDWNTWSRAHHAQLSITRCADAFPDEGIKIGASDFEDSDSEPEESDPEMPDQEESDLEKSEPDELVVRQPRQEPESHGNFARDRNILS